MIKRNLSIKLLLTLCHSALSYDTTQKMKFSIKDFSVNMTKFAGNCGLGHILWRNPYWKTSFFCSGWVLKLEINKNIIDLKVPLIFISHLSHCNRYSSSSVYKKHFVLIWRIVFKLNTYFVKGGWILPLSSN